MVPAIRLVRILTRSPLVCCGTYLERTASQANKEEQQNYFETALLAVVVGDGFVGRRCARVR
ncbi:MAG: hypothetical protein H0V73_05180 [Chloroflexi bacterium]|nr:hypothetical protein [Chloroflexota bacterium]